MLRPPRASLLIATLADTASRNIATHLLKQFSWQSLKCEEMDGNVYRSIGISYPIQEISTEETILTSKSSSLSRVYTRLPHDEIFLWLVDRPLLFFDHPDRQFSQYLPNLQQLATQMTPSLTSWPQEITEVTFLSKHVATSGTVSLTVHPIGVPYQLETSSHGGLPGHCSPPSVHLAPLYRAILNASKTIQNDENKKENNDPEFQVTLEATHHGPYVTVPTCFVEIGSAETEWNNLTAGSLWAETLGEYFHLWKRPSSSLMEMNSFNWNTMDTSDFIDLTDEELVNANSSIQNAFSMVSSTTCTTLDRENLTGITAILLGCGHYVPRMNDMGRFGEGLYLGHALASYALQPYWSEPEDLIVNGKQKWQQIIDEAINSTRQAFPATTLYVLVDKKSYTTEQREKLCKYLDEIQVKWTLKSTDIRRCYDEYVKSQVSSI